MTDNSTLYINTNTVKYYFSKSPDPELFNDGNSTVIHRCLKLELPLFLSNKEQKYVYDIITKKGRYINKVVYNYSFRNVKHIDDSVRLLSYILSSLTSVKILIVNDFFLGLPLNIYETVQSFCFHVSVNNDFLHHTRPIDTQDFPNLLNLNITWLDRKYRCSIDIDDAMKFLTYASRSEVTTTKAYGYTSNWYYNNAFTRKHVSKSLMIIRKNIPFVNVSRVDRGLEMLDLEMLDYVKNNKTLLSYCIRASNNKYKNQIICNNMRRIPIQFIKKLPKSYIYMILHLLYKKGTYTFKVQY